MRQKQGMSAVSAALSFGPRSQSLTETQRAKNVGSGALQSRREPKRAIYRATQRHEELREPSREPCRAIKSEESHLESRAETGRAKRAVRRAEI